MSGRVVSVSDLVVDLILPVSLPILPGRFQHVDFLRLEPGGAGNFMIAARNLGLDVAAVGSLGDDVFGQQLLTTLRDEGIDTSGIAITPSASSTAVLVMTDQTTGEHVFIGHHTEGPQATFTDAMAAAIQRADAVFVDGYVLVEQRTASLSIAAVENARELDKPIYFDVGPTMAHTPPDKIALALAHADVLLMTDDEVRYVSPQHTGDSAYAYLLESGPRTLVVKHGPGGCTVVERNYREHVPGFSVPVVDTVGAGDCFAAAFIAARLAGLSLRDAAVLANATGAASVQKIGAGRNAPTCVEVMAVLRQSQMELQFSC